MVRKGLVSFYKLRVLDHFGKKGARRRDQPYGGRFFGRWRSSDLRSAKKATPYSLAPHRAGQVSENAELRRAERRAEVWWFVTSCSSARRDMVKLYFILTVAPHRDDPRGMRL